MKANALSAIFVASVLAGCSGPSSPPPAGTPSAAASADEVELRQDPKGEIYWVESSYRTQAIGVPGMPSGPQTFDVTSKEMAKCVSIENERISWRYETVAFDAKGDEAMASKLAELRKEQASKVTNEVVDRQGVVVRSDDPDPVPLVFAGKAVKAGDQWKFETTAFGEIKGTIDYRLDKLEKVDGKLVATISGTFQGDDRLTMPKPHLWTVDVATGIPIRSSGTIRMAAGPSQFMIVEFESRTRW
jgi:hypothetical protein